MKIQVREASVADAPAIADIYITSWQSTYAGIIPDNLLQSLSVNQQTEEWSQQIVRDSRTVSVAEHAGNIVGFAYLDKNRDEDLKNEKLTPIELYDLYFHPSATRQGLGTQMWGLLEESLIGKLVVLWVLAGNLGAQHFYIKHGFEQDLVQGEYNFQGKTFRQVRYRKLID